MICTPSSLVPEDSQHSSISILMELYGQIEEKKKNIRENVVSQLEAQSKSKYQTRLLSIVDLERNQLKLSFSQPFAFSVSSTAGFKTMNLTVDARDIPFPNNINLHRKTGELIYSDLSKTSRATRKTKALLGNVINQLKLEKENSRSLYTQN